MLGCPTEFTEAVGAPGQVVPKRQASLSITPMTRSETNLDASVEESGPVRADEFGPTGADEDVVQKAEELKHVPAAILPSKAEVESHSASHLQFRIWCPACVRGRELSLGHRKVDTKTKEAEQIPTVWITGSLGNLKTEHMTRFQCSSCEIASVKASGVTQCRQRV